MQAYSIHCLNPVNRAIILLILRAVVAAVAIVAVNSVAGAAGCSFSARAVLFAWVVAACVLAGRCMAEIDSAGKVAAVESRPLPEWIADASEAVEPRHQANDELERALAELYELRTKLQQCAMWAADTEQCRKQSARKADEYRAALDGLGELWEGAHSKIMAAKIERRTAEDRETVAIAELLAERELLRKAILKNTKQAAVIAKLRGRLADRRERRRNAIDRELQRETVRASLRPIVYARGGIDCSSYAFTACYDSRSEAIEAGIPGYLLRTGKGYRKGEPLDTLADSLIADGYFQCPDDRNQGEYLLQLLREAAPSQLGETGRTYELAEERNQLDTDDYADVSFDPTEFEAIPL